MESVPDLIDKFGGATAFARAIGVGVSTASEMKRRASIPVNYWPTVILAANERDLAINEAEMLRLHIRQPAPEQTGAAA